MNISCFFVCLAAAFTMAPSFADQESAPRFRWSVVTAAGFNNLGQLVSADQHGTFITTDGRRDRLPPAPGDEIFFPAGINDHGSVMGSVGVFANSPSFLYRSGRYIDITTALGPVPREKVVRPWALNNLDHVVGLHNDKIYFYDGVSARYLAPGGIPLHFHEDVDINDHDVIAGTTFTINNRERIDQGLARSSLKCNTEA